MTSRLGSTVLILLFETKTPSAGSETKALRPKHCKPIRAQGLEHAVGKANAATDGGLILQRPDARIHESGGDLDW